MPDPNPINVEQTGANVVTSRKANPWLITLGAILVVVFIAGVVYARAEGSETVETTVPPKAAGAERASGTVDSSGQMEATEKTTTTKAIPSETLLTAVLATGAALIVIGVLYGRISTIKLPGGAEIGLTSDEKEKTAQKVGEKLKEKIADEDDPAKAAEITQKAAEVTQQATDRLSQAKAYGTVQLPDEAIDSAVEEAVETVGIE